MSIAKQDQSREFRKFIYVTKSIKIFQLLQYCQLPIYGYVVKNIRVILVFDFSTFCKIGDIEWYVN